jgi:hypothetical protein
MASSQENAMPTQTDRRPNNDQLDEPAKGGTKPAENKPHPSGDSLKKQGDKFEHAVDEAARKK